MSRRNVREGSVGLLALTGIVLLAGIAIWLRGFRFGQAQYEIVVDFPSVNGIQKGNKVYYRGLEVGNVADLKPSPNGVNVTLEIDSKLPIPKNVIVLALRSGLIGETSIDITPLEALSPELQKMDPLSDDCDSKKIICDGDVIQGEASVTLEQLLPTMARLANLYGDQEFFNNLNQTAKNASLAAEEVANLSRELAILSRSVRGDFSKFSNTAEEFSSTAEALTAAANNISRQITTTSDNYNSVAVEIQKLASNVNDLLEENRTGLVKTLNTITKTSDNLAVLVGNLNTSLESIDTKKLVKDLETLTANAAIATANLKNFSEQFNDPNNILVLQQTLDSARATFANTQKITSDLDEITGDPEFRRNLRRLIKGISELVSSTEQLEKQVEAAEILQPLTEEISQTVIKVKQRQTKKQEQKNQ